MALASRCKPPKPSSCSLSARKRYLLTSALQKSIPVQIRQLILNISDNKVFPPRSQAVLAAQRIATLQVRFQAKRAHHARFQGIRPESQGQNLALTVLYMPYSLDSPQPPGDETSPLYPEP